MSYEDHTQTGDLSKQTSPPSKHRGRKIAICCGVVVLIGAAIAISATSWDDPDNKPPHKTAQAGTSSPSPVQTFDGRYTNYDGTGFSPNLQATLSCKNGQASASAFLLVSRGESDWRASDLLRITPLKEQSSAKGCLWLVETPNNVWYKEAVSYGDTPKGYWKITRQEQLSGSAHVVSSGPNTTTQVLVQWDHLVDGPIPEQFHDSKQDAPGNGPDALKLPKPPAQPTAPASPPTTGKP